MILGGEHPDGWDTVLVDPRRQPHPTPCPDCGRTYLNGENVTVSVPTSEPTGQRSAWSGCVDCWVIRSRPAAAADRGDVEALAEALFQWNTSSDPYFVINGRSRADEDDADPYLPIARAVLTSPWFAARIEQARAGAGRGPGSFWTQSEWTAWSNLLASLIPDDDVSRYANPEGAQESIIAACLRAYVSERAEARADAWGRL